jgi:hypothetical protein
LPTRSSGSSARRAPVRAALRRPGTWLLAVLLVVGVSTLLTAV